MQKARVHIVIPEKTLFEKDKKEPTASVILHFKNGKINYNKLHDKKKNAIKKRKKNCFNKNEFIKTNQSIYLFFIFSS